MPRNSPPQSLDCLERLVAIPRFTLHGGTGAQSLGTSTHSDLPSRDPQVAHEFMAEF